MPVAMGTLEGTLCFFKYKPLPLILAGAGVESRELNSSVSSFFCCINESGRISLEVGEPPGLSLTRPFSCFACACACAVSAPFKSEMVDFIVYAGEAWEVTGTPRGLLSANAIPL